MKIIREQRTRTTSEKIITQALLVIVGVILNLLGSTIAGALGLPLYIDSVGTIMSAMLGGYVPGIIVGLLSSFVNSLLTESTAMSYGVLGAMIAVCTVWFLKGGWFSKPLGIIRALLIYAVIGGLLGSFLTMALFGFGAENVTSGLVSAIYKTGYFAPWVAEVIADYLIDVLDKAVTLLIVYVILKLLPKRLKNRFSIHMWRQAPLTSEAIREIREKSKVSMSLRTKLIVLLSLAASITAIAAIIISYVLYLDSAIRQQSVYGDSISKVVASEIDGNLIDEYMEKGDELSEYGRIERRLEEIARNSDYVQYVYVYKIMEDGCHVVFDVDTEDEEGSSPGDVVPFDESFMEYLPALLAGKEIEPLVTDDSYGWLLSVYTPIKNDAGETAAYAAVDISMEQVRSDAYSFFAKQMSFFLGIFILILALGLYLAEYQIILPLNAMSYTAESYSEDEKESLKETADTLKELDIRTGDEIENLYHAFSDMTSENLEYIKDIKKKNETISEMQNALIFVLADMVESRDQNTGDHVKKTAAYTKIIMDEMLREGIYTDKLTEEFMSDVYQSAPLHDIGKISIPDAVLNKPGKLTDEEFAIMKTHSKVGADIIERVIETVPGSDDGYLSEAKNLALYHHEKWNGQGYPTGISGEEIPLSARIMAVADVFDALASERSYKKAFPFEKAIEIIREGAGSHFDPLVAGAFLNAEDKVREVAENRMADL